MNGLQVTNGLQSDTITANTIGIDGDILRMRTIDGIDQISYSNISTGLRDIGIEFQPSPLSLLETQNDTGILNIRAGNVNIGNANQSSVIYLNGVVYFSNPTNGINFGDFIRQI